MIEQGPKLHTSIAQGTNQKHAQRVLTGKIKAQLTATMVVKI